MKLCVNVLPINSKFNGNYEMFEKRKITLDNVSSEFIIEMTCMGYEIRRLEL